MIDPRRVALFIPANLKAFKLNLFERIGRHIQDFGGKVVRHSISELVALCDKDGLIPIIGCQPESTQAILDWKKAGKDYIYWDRGYARRVFATCLPTGDNGGFYRWHVNAFQMRKIKPLPDDRWRALNTEVTPWRKGGRHVVIAAPTRTYARFHRAESWIADTIDALARVTDRQLVIRDKEQYRRRPMQLDLEGAHCLVTSGSNAAVESVIMGCPVFVHPDSAAALVGLTDLSKIEAPVYPERQPWLNALAYSQFDERELCDGTLWRLIE